MPNNRIRNKEYNVIAMYPYNNTTNEYTAQMQRILEEKYNVVNYSLLKRGILRHEDIDCLYLNWIENSMDEDDEYIISKAKKNDVKIIYVFHNRIPHDSKDITEAVRRTKLLIGVADIVIVHSKSSVRIINEIDELCDESKVKYIPHVNYCGIYNDWIGDVRKKYGFKSNDFVVGFFGAIRPYKNLELLIECFNDADIMEKHNLKLLVAGKSIDEKYGKTIQSQIKDSGKIVFLNAFINNNAMGSLMKAVDVVALPYDILSSLNSGSMLMSFSLKKTVIIPRIPMCDEFPDEFLFKYDYSNMKEHYKGLKKTIIKAYDYGSAMCRKKGEGLYKIVVEKNSYEIVRSMLLDVVDNLFIDSLEIRQMASSQLQYLYDVVYEYLCLQKSGKKMSDFFILNQIKSIAIYGLGRIGKLVITDLRNEIEIKYAIDKNRNIIDSDFKVYSPFDELPTVDAIIFTVSDYMEVAKILRIDNSCKMLSLFDIIQCAALL